MRGGRRGSTRRRAARDGGRGRRGRDRTRRARRARTSSRRASGHARRRPPRARDRRSGARAGRGVRDATTVVITVVVVFTFEFKIATTRLVSGASQCPRAVLARRWRRFGRRRVPSRRRLVRGGRAARLLLLLWGLYQDATFEEPYTDVDYDVFTDAARFVARDASPYERTTYRYTPLLAFALLPNVLVHPAWGKVLFALFDLLAGALILRVLRAQGHRERACVAACAAWLFNPFTIAVSTRGSCESIPATLVLVALERIAAGRPAHAGLAHGAATHLRIVPVAYALPILVFLDAAYERDAAAAIAYSAAAAAAEREDPRRGRKTRPLAPARTSSPPRPREGQKKNERAPPCPSAPAFAASSFATSRRSAPSASRSTARSSSRRRTRTTLASRRQAQLFELSARVPERRRDRGDSRGAHDHGDETPARSQPQPASETASETRRRPRAARAASPLSPPPGRRSPSSPRSASSPRETSPPRSSRRSVSSPSTPSSPRSISCGISAWRLRSANALRTRGARAAREEEPEGRKTPFFPREDEDEEPPLLRAEVGGGARVRRVAGGAGGVARGGVQPEFRGAPRGFELAWLAGLGFLFANARAVAAFARALGGGGLDGDAEALDRDAAALRGDAAALHRDAPQRRTA